MGFVPHIRKDTGEWYIVEVCLTGKTDHNAAYIALKLKEYFDGRDGIIFICNSKNVLVLAHMGRNVEGESISNGIHEKLPQHSCTAQTSDVTPDGLVKIQLRLEALEQDNESQPQVSRLLSARQKRADRIVMVVDDDAFMRSLASKTFRAKGRVIGFKNANKVLEAYLEYLPDIVFLDIHLPDGSGMDLLVEILSFDASAHVVILSADSVKDNIVSARERGAKDFIAKPFTLEKLESCYSKCPTVTSHGTMKAGS